jgi:hypothetical protein
LEVAVLVALAVVVAVVAVVEAVAGDGGDDDDNLVVAAAAAHPGEVARPVPRCQYLTAMLRRRAMSFSYPLGCHRFTQGAYKFSLFPKHPLRVDILLI